MVTAPAGLVHIPFGNPRDVPVAPARKHVRKVTDAGVTVIERMSTDKVAVVDPSADASAGGPGIIVTRLAPSPSRTVARSADDRWREFGRNRIMDLC
jgi:hypothetical protein